MKRVQQRRARKKKEKKKGSSKQEGPDWKKRMKNARTLWGKSKSRKKKKTCRQPSEKGGEASKNNTPRLNDKGKTP